MIARSSLSLVALLLSPDPHWNRVCGSYGSSRTNLAPSTWRTTASP